jgi:hypothetical protein
MKAIVLSIRSPVRRPSLRRVFPRSRSYGAAGLLIALVLVCFGLAPMAQAVVPAPDGGYPGGNTAEGENALFSLTTGTYNTAVGSSSLRATTTGDFSTATGDRALFSNTIGSSNTATGSQALFRNTEGESNTANGVQALFNNTAGSNNTANGMLALARNRTGSGNTALGFEAGIGVTTADNAICIGATGANVSNSCYIGQIFGATSSGGIAVFVNGNGKLGTATSSRRFKEEIKPMERASEALLALRPVTFRYKPELDPDGIPQFGLVAEEVEKVNPDLVVRDKEGKAYTVRYDAVNAMLLNEFLKEHRKVEELKSAQEKQQAMIAEQQKEFQVTTEEQKKDFESKIAYQQKQIEALTTGLQKVSDQLELSKSAHRTVVENR